MNTSAPSLVARLLVVVLLGSGPLHAEPTALESVEKAAGDWVKVRAETTRLQVEWSTQRQLLESMVNGLEERAKTLELRQEYLQAKTAKDRDELAKLAAADSAAAAGLQVTEARLKALDASLLQLRPSLPPRLSAALDLPFKSLGAPELTVAERMQLTLTVLNRCTQFNRGISFEPELLNPGNEANPQLLEVIYWGLSHGYALDRGKDRAWMGSPGPAGWQWAPLPAGAKHVDELFAVAQGRSEPVFVAMPAQLRNQPANAAKN